MHYRILRPMHGRAPAYEDTAGWQQLLQLMGMPQQVNSYCSLNGAFLEDLGRIPGPENGDHFDYIPSQLMFLINDLQYAQQLAAHYPGSRIFGVQFDPQPGQLTESPDLLGFDLLDQGGHYSLLDNPRQLETLFERQVLNQNALIDRLELAIDLKQCFRSRFGETDWHARNCEVWAVYQISSKTNQHVTQP